MTKVSNRSAVTGFHAKAWLLGLLCLVAILVPHGPVHAQSLQQGNYYWYMPEHEKYSLTVFYGEPRFDTRQIRVKSVQRFKLLAGSKGWFMIQFDIAGKAYIHQRLLRSLMYDPTVSDPLYEFQRASVFEEEPAKIEARLKSVRSDPQAAERDSKVPAWKRYKDSWGLKHGRTTPLPSATGETTADAASSPSPTRAQDKKQKNKYPLLPPIGSQPKPENTESESAPVPDGTNVPMPNLP